MLVYYSQLKGMEVLAEAEGALLGSVRRVLFDSRRRCAEAITFKGRGVVNERWVPVSAVRRLGRDVIFVGMLAEVREDQPGGRDVRDIQGLPVNTLDGKLLGQLQDLVFDTSDWSIKLLHLQGGREAELDQRSVLGEDAVLLSAGVRLSLSPTGEKRTGFLARVLGKEDTTSKPPDDRQGKP